MAIQLHVEPRETYTWTQFLEQFPAYSIALDGFVNEGPKSDLLLPMMNLNHHEGVVRDATMSTSKQALFKIKGGLFRRYRLGGIANAHLWVNDCDEDICFSTYILKNHKLVQGTKSIPRLNKLLDVVDKRDITAGAWPQKFDEEFLKASKWIFDPYRTLRMEGKIMEANADTIEGVIKEVWERITRYKNRKEERIALDISHDIVHKNNYCTFVKEIGSEARPYLFSQGMNAFISFMGQRKDGNHVYVIGRRSDIIPFPMEQFYDLFNEVEGIAPDNKDRWGGSDIVGGSPRMCGSKLTPQEITDIVNSNLKRLRKEIYGLRYYRP